jgi:Zn-dependent M16 (insulinase) family peptidase
LRVKLITIGLIEIIPHYRGEQNYDWDITSGVFRKPLENLPPEKAKELEKNAIKEFENVVTEKISTKILRNIFNDKGFGKDWDLLFQAQHFYHRASRASSSFLLLK